MHHYFYHCVQYELLLENYCNSLLVVQLFTYCKKYLAKKNLSIHLHIPTYHYPISFDTTFTNNETTLKQRQDIVVSTLFQRRTLTSYQRCATWKTRRRICFILNVDPQQLNNVDPTLKCWLGTLWNSNNSLHP